MRAGEPALGGIEFLRERLDLGSSPVTDRADARGVQEWFKKTS